MILDYNAANRNFLLYVKHGEADPLELKSLYGLDFSTKASTPQTGVFFTTTPYAAAPFARYATPNAVAPLAGILGAIDASWAPSSRANILIPADKELWPFQIADVAYCLERKHSLVGDEPGLGKTPIGIAFCNEVRAKRVLVICPASIRRQWARRIREWSTMRWPFSINVIQNSRRGVHPDAEWTVVSFELISSEGIGNALVKGHYDVMIIDEAHYLKTPETRRTRAVFGGGKHPRIPLIDCAERVIALTGTPLPNRPREAYTLANGLCPDSIDFMSEAKFQARFNPSERFCVTGADGRVVWITSEATGRQAELRCRLRANFMTRHLKRDVMPQLKRPIYDLIYLNETAAVRAALEKERLLDIDWKTLNGDIKILGQVATVRRELGIAMAPQVADYVAMLIDGGEEKLVLFAWHIEVLNILERELAEYGVVRIDGGTSGAKKEKLIKQFQTDPKTHIAIGNMLSMGVGTDGFQHVCNHALIAEPDWVFGNNVQAFDRLDRGGQLRTVQGDIFVTEGSLCEKILADALAKGADVYQALDRRD